MNEPARWFRQAIGRGLQALVVLHLPGAPGHETVGHTRDVWVSMLWEAPVQWDEQADSTRIEAAFKRVGRQVDRWPAPRQLLELMPARPQPPALPRPQMTQAQRERNRARLREALEKVRNG